MGFTNLSVLEGGLNAWRESYPVEPTGTPAGLPG
jgi:hypothetical protein